jgi:hypothetical protein
MAQMWRWAWVLGRSGTTFPGSLQLVQLIGVTAADTQSAHNRHHFSDYLSLQARRVTADRAVIGRNMQNFRMQMKFFSIFSKKFQHTRFHCLILLSTANVVTLGG